jgi:Putative peptidoglycan binding domain
LALIHAEPKINNVMPREIDTHLDCISTTQVIRAAGYELIGRYYRMPQSEMTPLRTPESAALSRRDYQSFRFGNIVPALMIKVAVVRRIQESLSSEGFDPGEVDGECGPNTAMAVAAFQATRGLVSDGEVGPQTAVALGITLA